MFRMKRSGMGPECEPNGWITNFSSPRLSQMRGLIRVRESMKLKIIELHPGPRASNESITDSGGCLGKWGRSDLMNCLICRKQKKLDLSKSNRDDSPAESVTSPLSWKSLKSWKSQAQKIRSDIDGENRWFVKPEWRVRSAQNVYGIVSRVWES